MPLRSPSSGRASFYSSCRFAVAGTADSFTGLYCVYVLVHCAWGSVWMCGVGWFVPPYVRFLLLTGPL